MDSTLTPPTAPDARGTAVGGGPLPVVAAIAWLAVAVTAGLDLPYLAFTVAVAAASTTTLWLAIRATGPRRPGSGARVARSLAVAVAVLGIVVAVVVPWASAVWAPVQAVGYLALAATGRRQARWVAVLAVPLLASLALAIVGVAAEIGDPGEEADYSQVQEWALALCCVAMAAVLAWRARPAGVRS